MLCSLDNPMQVEQELKGDALKEKAGGLGPQRGEL